MTKTFGDLTKHTRDWRANANLAKVADEVKEEEEAKKRRLSTISGGIDNSALVQDS